MENEQDQGKSKGQGQTNDNQDPGSKAVSRQQRSKARLENVLAPVQLPFASPFLLMRRLMENLDDLIIDGQALVGRQDTSDARDRRAAGVTLWIPPLELAERDGKLVIRADVPGIAKDQLRVDVEDGELVISGERTQDVEETRGGIYRSERRYGRFTRAVALPEGADVDQAKATFANGVLEITIPAPPRQRGKSIEIGDAPQGKPAH